MSIRLEEGLRDYINYRQKKGSRASAIQSKLNKLNLFIKQKKLEGYERVSEITRESIEEYVSQRYYHINKKGRQNVAGTRSNEVGAIKAFFIFLTEKDYIENNPAREISTVKCPQQGLPKNILSKRDILRLLKQPDMTTLKGYRDRVCMEVLVATGIRREELIMLNVGDVQLNEKVIMIREGKGLKDRVVPINETTRQYLKNYMAHIRPKMQHERKCDKEALFPSEKSNRLTGQGLISRIRRYAKLAKLKKNISFHTFRHTVATLLIQRGMPARHVQELLGHENLDTTMRYLQLSTMDLQREYRKTHPREKPI